MFNSPYFFFSGVFTEVSSDEQFLEDVSQAISDSESPSEVNYDDRDYSGRGLLDLLMTRPNKRQWCRKGMTYNHVLGSCTLSFSVKIFTFSFADFSNIHTELSCLLGEM